VRELQAVGRDITERKRTEQDLRIKDRALATAINAIIITTLDGKAVYVNDVHCSMFGYSRKEALQLNAVDLASDSVEAHQVIDSVQSQGFFAGESIAKRKDGSRFTVQISASLITSLEGQPIAMMASFVDITERRLIEEKLRESETRLRAIFENSLDGIVVTQDDKFVMCNKVFVQMLGVENPVELTGISATMFAAPDGQEAIAEHTRGIALGKSVPNFYEATARSKDGRLLPVEASISDYKIKDVHYTLGIVRNITERRQVEEKLRESEERFSTAFHASPVAQVISVLESGLFLDVNEAFSGLMGYTSDELIGHTSKELNLWMDFKDRQKTVKQLNLDGNMHNMEMQLVNRSGEPRIVLVSIALIVLGGKKCMISTLLDITERKQIESALRESEQRYRALAEAAYDMIFVIDRDDYITYVNSFASMQLGMQPDALIGQPRSRWFGKSDTDRMLNNLKQVFETGKPQYAESETVFTRGAVYLSTWLVPLRDERGVVAQVLGVSRDISELKKLERSLKKTNQQLEARVEKRTAALSDSHNRLRELTQQIVIAQEEERRRISRELHDEAGQALIGLRFSLDAIYRELPVNLRKIRRRMAKALAQTDQTIQWMRALA
jgi:PAS domain S-box-containing protein